MKWSYLQNRNRIIDVANKLIVTKEGKDWRIHFGIGTDNIQSSSIQSLGHVWLFATPWTAAYQASLPITNSQSLLKFMSNQLVMPSNHFILCHPLLLPPSMFPSIKVFSKESVLCIRWPKYWSFSFSISPSNEYSGLISFRMDWLYFLAVQGTLSFFFFFFFLILSCIYCIFTLVQQSQGNLFFILFLNFTILY